MTQMLYPQKVALMRKMHFCSWLELVCSGARWQMILSSPSIGGQQLKHPQLQQSDQFHLKTTVKEPVVTADNSPGKS